jgi:hypothetical protein
MNALRRLAVGTLVLLALPWGTARAGHGFWSFGINFGVPLYRPWCCGYPYYYYRPYPVVVEPAPVVLQPAPVVQPVPVVQGTCQAQAAPAVSVPATPPPPLAARAPQQDERPGEVDRHLQLLADPDERVRAEAAIQLGRMQAQRATDRLVSTLATDASPNVRESAARALGLIGSPRALPALRRAAQADGDRDVRHSAQFAAEVVQAGPGR